MKYWFSKIEPNQQHINRNYILFCWYLMIPTIMNIKQKVKSTSLKIMLGLFMKSSSLTISMIIQKYLAMSVRTTQGSQLSWNFTVVLKLSWNQQLSWNYSLGQNVLIWTFVMLSLHFFTSHDYVYVADVECQVMFSLVTLCCSMCNIALVTFLGLQYWSASMINIYEHRKTCIFCVLSVMKPTKVSWNCPEIF